MSFFSSAIVTSFLGTHIIGVSFSDTPEPAIFS
jgi:hypothetical protein